MFVVCFCRLQDHGADSRTDTEANTESEETAGTGSGEERV